MKNRSQSGQIMPFVALALTALLGVGGMGVDVGTWEYHQRTQQSAVDSAALGGAQQLTYSNCTGSSAAITAAQNDAANSGYPAGGNVTLTVQTPPQSGPYAGNSCAVSVQITNAKVPSFFARFFGKQNGVTESTSAVAVASQKNNDCVYMLGTTQTTVFNGTKMNAPSCSIQLNGAGNFNGGTINAGSIGEGNFTGSHNGGSFTGGQPAASLPVANPCPEIPGCAQLASNPPSTSNCTAKYSGGGTLQPGCYTNINLNGNCVTLAAGTYTFAGSSNFNGSMIDGSAGVTIYIPAGASANFNGVTPLTLTPPSSGSYAGVSYYQAPSNTSTVNFNGSSASLSGLIYAPGAEINYNGGQGKYVVLVGLYGNFNGTSGEDFGAPTGSETYLVRKAVLAQ
ncbi:MAG TPA: pilus assembly protein TadG-related protein [Candidatus Cybelea sp.]|jgi:Flp pilus assembly protein TadG|nr:pilus assembly protein TadG-related protein [Candidatus Cybelea sp.]